MFTTINDYTIIRFKKSSGKIRTIYAPKEHIKNKQRLHIPVMYSDLFLSKFAHGFAIKRNIVTNALPHVGKKWVLKVDIKDCFHSIKWDIFKKYYIKHKEYKGHDEKKALKDLEAYKIHFLNYNDRIFLPQGAPGSPVICNFVLSYFDMMIVRGMFHFVKQGYNFDYTRYADDLTFSCDNKYILKRALNYTIRYIKYFGLSINKDKIRFIPHWKRQVICGIVVNEKVNLPRKERKKIRAMMHQIKTGERPLDNHALGKLSYLNMIDKYNSPDNIMTIHKYFYTKASELLLK